MGKKPQPPVKLRSLVNGVWKRGALAVRSARRARKLAPEGLWYGRKGSVPAGKRGRGIGHDRRALRIAITRSGAIPSAPFEEPSAIARRRTLGQRKPGRPRAALAVHLGLLALFLDGKHRVCLGYFAENIANFRCDGFFGLPLASSRACSIHICFGHLYDPTRAPKS